MTEKFAEPKIFNTKEEVLSWIKDNKEIVLMHHITKLSDGKVSLKYVPRRLAG